MLMLSESAKATKMMYPNLKVSGEESTDEGSNSSDNESVVVPVAKSNEGGAFSRSALRARGEAALARLQAQSQTEDAVASPPPTDRKANHRTQWSPTECKKDGRQTKWSPQECSHWSPENTVGEQDWSQDAWEVNRMMGFEPLPTHCEQCPWEMTTGAEPWATNDPWGNSIMAEAEHFAALSQPQDVGITQSCENDPIFQLLERSSTGRPVKVQVPEMSASLSLPKKQLNMGVPVKKRPPFPECVGSYKALDPTVPAKKRMPTFLLEAVSA
jgi:hypothetical protein